MGRATAISPTAREELGRKRSHDDLLKSVRGDACQEKIPDTSSAPVTRRAQPIAASPSQTIHPDTLSAPLFRRNIPTQDSSAVADMAVELDKIPDWTTDCPTN